jgi:hypothetical protein
MRLKLGNWAGGAEGNPKGTIEWAGGKTDFSKAPFDMYVQDVSIKNYNPAASYEYGDKSGSWQSIKINKDGSSSNDTSSSSSASSGSSATATTSTSASSAPSTTGANNSTSTEKPEKEASSSSPSTSTTQVYTSQASVEPIDQHTEAAVSVTQTGSMYSTNTASASALNSAISAATSTISTRVSDSKPTGNAGNSSSTSSAAAAEQTTNAGVKLGAAGSVVGIALGVLML